MPSRAEHSRPLTSRTSNVLPTVDNVKNDQSQIVVLDTSQQVVVSLPFLLSKILHFSVHHSMRSILLTNLSMSLSYNFYDPYLVVQFMYIKSAFDQQIKQVSTFCILSFKTVSDLPHKRIHRHRQPPTLPKLKNCSPSIVWPHNCSPSIAIIIINHKLVVLKSEYFSSFLFIITQTFITHSLTAKKGLTETSPFI